MPTCRSKPDHEGHKFIYIHTPKTGGVSLTTALGAHVVPYEDDLDLRNSILEHSHALLGAYQGILFWHITLRDLMRHYGEFQIKEFYSFSFIRNPLDWLVSMYQFIRRTSEHPESMILGHMDFRQFLLYWGSKSVQQVDFMRGYGQSPALTEIHRFEDFNTAIERISEQCDLKLEVPHLNASTATETWRSYYDRNTFEAACKMFHEDIRVGGYELEY